MFLARGQAFNDPASANNLLVFFLEQITRNLTFGNFAQGNDRRLIIFFRHHRLSPLGSELTRTLGSQHYQLEAVINVFQTIFNGNSCHNFPDK